MQCETQEDLQLWTKIIKLNQKITNTLPAGPLSGPPFEDEVPAKKDKKAEKERKEREKEEQKQRERDEKDAAKKQSVARKASKKEDKAKRKR